MPLHTDPNEMGSMGSEMKKPAVIAQGGLGGGLGVGQKGYADLFVSTTHRVSECVRHLECTKTSICPQVSHFGVRC